MAFRGLTLAARVAGVRSFGSPAVAGLPNFVANSPAASLTTTGSGLKIASITTPGETATITVWVDAGSRYETAETNGVANLYETAAMKSKVAEIAAIGGLVKSYTSRE